MRLMMPFDPDLNLIPDDPRVDCFRWTTECTLDLQNPPEACGLDEMSWAEALAHEAVWVDGYPRGIDAPGEAPAGARIVVYTHQSTPPALTLPDGAILHDAHGVVAVNKPAGMSTQRTRASARRCMQWLLQEKLGDSGLRAVHRLDRDTSGVVLFARDRETTAALHKQFQARRVDKRYLAVVPGLPKVATTVEGHMYRLPKGHQPTPPEGPQPRSPVQLKFTMGPEPRPELDSRPSETRFTRLRQLGARSLVEARPITGRTHQIRVHLDHLGLPICGDRLYGPGEALQRAPRLMLHAARIEVPLNRNPIAIECPAPKAFTAGWTEESER
ncbi:MAG: RluA family pseudouridine synthase [Bradymonadia bacterium]